MQGKVYKKEVRSAMMYGFDTLALTESQETELEVE